MAATRRGDPPEAKWHRARLIPSVGIRGSREQEQRATSSLLAVMSAVPDFGRVVLTVLGARSGTIETYTEPRFETERGGTKRPDGAIVVTRGQYRWSCLVEVKTGGNSLGADQIESYLDLARASSLDGLLTISNDIASSSSELPVSVDQRKVKGLVVRHLSWWRILTTAIVEKEHHGIDDPDQAWLLGELIEYLKDPKSGASGFEDMGQSWTEVRDGARAGTLRQGDAVRGIADGWEQFIEYVSLELRQELGRRVEPAWPRKSTRASRLSDSTRSLVGDGTLSAAIKVPDAAGAIEVVADLRARQFVVVAEIDAPKKGRPQTRINWMLRQLRDVSVDLVVEARYPNAREHPSMKLSGAIERPEHLLYPGDPKREPRSFRLSLPRNLGRKKGKEAGSFIGEGSDQIKDFYGDVLQRIRAWQPSAPKLRDAPREDEPSVELDGPDASGARDSNDEGTGTI